MKIILCGYNWAGCKALELLLSAGHEVFVYTHESENCIASLESFCKKIKVPYSLESINKSELPFQPDLIISIYYRYIIKPHVIESVQGRIFNLHPALLPKYRGCSSLTWALINGESKVGYTYHYIDLGCDTGNIIIQKEVPVESFDTQLSLYYKTMFFALNDLLDAVELVKKGFSGIPQIGESSYYKRGCPYNAEIDDNWPIEKVERFIRAMIFPPYSPATYKGEYVYNIDDYLKLKEIDK